MNYLTCSLTGVPSLDLVYSLENHQVYDRVAYLSEITKSANSHEKDDQLNPATIIKLNLNLTEEEYFSSSEILQNEIDILNGQISQIDHENQILAREIAQNLIKNKILRQNSKEIQSDVSLNSKSSQNTKTLEQRKAAFVSKLRTYYNLKIELNKKMRLEEKEVPILFSEKSSFNNFQIDAKVRFACFTPQANYCFLADKLGTLSLIEINDMLLVDKIEFPENPLFASAFENKSKVVCFFVFENKIGKATYENSPRSLSYFEKVVYSENSDPVLDLKIHSSGEFVAFLFQNRVEFRTTSDLEEEFTYVLPKNQLSFDLHNDGKLMALISSEKPVSVQFFDLIEGKVMASFESNSSLRTVCFSKDRFHFLVDKNSETVLVDLRTRKEIRKWKKTDAGGFSLDGETIYMITQNTAQVFRVSDNSVEKQFCAADLNQQVVAFAINKNRAFVFSEDKIRVVDI